MQIKTEQAVEDKFSYSFCQEIGLSLLTQFSIVLLQDIRQPTLQLNLNIISIQLHIEFDIGLVRKHLFGMRANRLNLSEPLILRGVKYSLGEILLFF